ncbi:hypothetical protein BpHYR1_028208 [Brachionus plicatilis]|uniref:Uncharacterized protein n=1 Tax=Brachionus plicatilis TaxID=10195 RepID=A0A3M7P8C6_BRAPC|nr:hypothetical protein BpHYR1_028208 [Brachionus plicatilis]
MAATSQGVLFDYTLSCRVVNQWNSLPSAVTDSNSVNQFKKSNDDLMTGHQVLPHSNIYPSQFPLFFSYFCTADRTEFKIKLKHSVFKRCSVFINFMIFE